MDIFHYELTISEKWYMRLFDLAVSDSIAAATPAGIASFPQLNETPYSDQRVLLNSWRDQVLIPKRKLNLPISNRTLQRC